MSWFRPRGVVWLKPKIVFGIGGREETELWKGLRAFMSSSLKGSERSVLLLNISMAAMDLKKERFFKTYIGKEEVNREGLKTHPLSWIEIEIKNL